MTPSGSRKARDRERPRASPTHAALPPEDGEDEDAPGRDVPDALIAEAHDDQAEAAPRRDPDEVALELLKTELGARPIDG